MSEYNIFERKTTTMTAVGFSDIWNILIGSFLFSAFLELIPKIWKSTLIFAGILLVGKIFS